MMNEIVKHFKKNKENLLIFKVDFEKSYDSLSWEYLDCMMEFMGFKMVWREWIRGCLESAKASVLLNGNPTKEFQVHRGLRQGDPLSPFLFILAMEGLYVAMEDTVHHSLYKEVNVGNLQILVSHLFYADDAIFVGKL